MDATQRRVLATVENELRAVPELAATFEAFTLATRNSAMPAAEQLAARGWRSWWRAAPAFLRRLIILVPSAWSVRGARPRSHASTR